MGEIIIIIIIIITIISGCLKILFFLLPGLLRVLGLTAEAKAFQQRENRTRRYARPMRARESPERGTLAEKNKNHKDCALRSLGMGGWGVGG